MRALRALLGLGTVVAVAIPAQATVFLDNIQVVAIPPAGQPGDPTMVFYDDFNAAAFDPQKWMVLAGAPEIVPSQPPEPAGGGLAAFDSGDVLKSVTFSEIPLFPSTVVISTDEVVIPSLAPGEMFVIAAGDSLVINHYTIGFLPGIAFLGDKDGVLGAIPYPEGVPSTLSLLVTPPVEGLGLSYVKAMIKPIGSPDEFTIFEGGHVPFNLEWLLIAHIPEPSSLLLLGAGVLFLKRRRSACAA